MPIFVDPIITPVASPTHIFLDFDGVMTDNSVYVDNEGNETVKCSKWDSWAIETCKAKGYTFIVVSLEKGRHVHQRSFKLGIQSYQGIHDKTQFIDFYCKDKGIPITQCAYIGNDVADVEALKFVRLGACPSDSHPSAIAAADYLLSNRGGDGAVREFCDSFLTQAIK